MAWPLRSACPGALRFATLGCRDDAAVDQAVCRVEYGTAHAQQIAQHWGGIFLLPTTGLTPKGPRRRKRLSEMKLHLGSRPGISW